MPVSDSEGPIGVPTRTYINIHQSPYDPGKTNLDPKRSSFPDGCELSRLVMCESERRHVLVLTREVRESGDNYRDFGDEEGEGFAEEYQICIAGNRRCKRGYSVECEWGESDGTNSVTKHDVAPRLANVQNEIRSRAGRRIGEDGLDDPCSSRRNNSERMHMGHNIVSSFLLFLSSNLELPLV